MFVTPLHAFSGLVTATVASELNSSAQPALLYLVPFTLLPLVTMAYIKVSFHILHAWFVSKNVIFSEAVVGYEFASRM